MTDVSADLHRALDLIDSGDLSSAHTIAQAYEGDAIADSIHAIIHRKEGDYSNSLYWWHRVGKNVPVLLLAVCDDPSEFTITVRDGSHSKDLSAIEHSEIMALHRSIAAISVGDLQ